MAKPFHKSKSRKRSKAGKKAYETRMANEAAAADAADVVADVAPVAADPAPAKRREVPEESHMCLMLAEMVNCTF